MIRATIKPYLQEAQKLGCEVVSTSDTAKSHCKIVLSARNKTRFFIASNSPSDRKSVKNFARHIRTWLREIENA